MSDTTPVHIPEETSRLTRAQKLIAVLVGTLTTIGLLSAGVVRVGTAVADQRTYADRVEAQGAAIARHQTALAQQDVAIAQLRDAQGQLRDALRMDHDALVRIEANQQRIEINTCITVAAITHTSPERCKAK